MLVVDDDPALSTRTSSDAGAVFTKQQFSRLVACNMLFNITKIQALVGDAGLAVIAFMQFGTLQMMTVVAGTALLITTLEGWLLTPTLLGRAAQMNQVAVFAGLLFWSWLWGVWGLLLAVPMMMIIKTTCEHTEDLRPVADLLSD